MPVNNGPLDFETSGEALLTSGRDGLLRWPIRFAERDSTQVEVGPPRLVQNVASGAAGRSADGSVLAFAIGTRALIWRPLENRTLLTRGLEADIRYCAVSPDGRWVATGSGELLEGAGAKVWDAATGQLAAELPLGRMSRVWFSPDGKWLVTGSSAFRLWQVGSWDAGPSLDDTEQAESFRAFTWDGRLLALGDTPGVVHLVDPDTGRELARLVAPVQTRLWPKCFTPDGSKLIVIGSDTQTCCTSSICA